MIRISGWFYDFAYLLYAWECPSWLKHIGMFSFRMIYLVTCKLFPMIVIAILFGTVGWVFSEDTWTHWVMFIFLGLMVGDAFRYNWNETKTETTDIVKKWKGVDSEE